MPELSNMFYLFIFDCQVLLYSTHILLAIQYIRLSLQKTQILYCLPVQRKQ